MQKKVFILIFVAFFVLCSLFTALLALSSIYSLNENEYAVITQSDEIVKVVSDPGIHFKLPFIQRVSLVYKSIAVAKTKFQAITRDNNYLHVRARVQWKVSDPAVYFVKMQSFDTSRNLAIKFVVEDSKKIFSESLVAKLLLCKSDQTTNFCKVNPSVFLHSNKKLSKLSEPYGFRIIHIDATAKIEKP